MKVSVAYSYYWEDEIILWITLHKSLTTISMLCDRGMLQTDLCPKCNQDVEMTLHCLRDCELSTRFWKYIDFLNPIYFQGDNVYDWVRHGINDDSMFFTACWWLWHARNKPCLVNKVVSSYTLKIITVNYDNLLTKYFLKYNMSHPARTITWNTHKVVIWFWMLMTVVSVIPTYRGFGILIRNTDKAWVCGFTNNIGYFNILHGELTTIYHGLSMVWLSIKDMMCYSNSNSVIKLISKSWHHYATILLNIKELLSKYVREYNVCADYLIMMQCVPIFCRISGKNYHSPIN